MPKKGIRNPPPCKVCGEPAKEKKHNRKFKGYLKCCEKHYNWHRQPGPNHPNAKRNGRRMNPQGYIEILDPKKHGAKSGSRYSLEHRLIAQAKEGEVIHHANGVRHDNRPENLVILGPNDEHESQTYIKVLQKHIRNLEEEVARLCATNTRSV